MDWRNRLIKGLDLKNNSQHQAIVLALSFVLIISFVYLFKSTPTQILSLFKNNQGRVADAAWYNSNWSFRKKITIDHTKVDADLTDFPVLINYDEEGDLKNYAQSDGDDILFTQSDGTTKLSHQIENYDDTDGSLRAWVKTNLSSTTDTELYIYYGNDSASDQQNVTDVWSNSYAGVWHLDEEEAGTGSAGTYKDSTTNNNDGDDYVSATGQDGQVDGGQEFDGVDDYVEVSDDDSLDIDGEMFISLWVNSKRASITTREGIFNKWTSTKSKDFVLRLHTEDDTEPERTPVFHWRDKDENLRYAEAPSALTKDLWHFITITYDGSGAIVWVDGVAGEKETGVPTDLINSANLEFSNDGPWWFYFNGSIDEARISNTTRSAEWISTEYNNQNSPSTFYTTYGQEAQSTDWYNSSWKYRKKITIDSTKVDDDLYQFPTSISLTDGNIVNKAQADGDDIVFTNTDGTSKLSHEIEEFNEDTGEVVVHVKVPQLSQNTNTDIYLYYGNPSAGNQQNSTDVWSNGYAGVWHMNETSGTTVYDSTANNNDGTIATSSNNSVSNETFTSSYDTYVDLSKRELQSGTETVTTTDEVTTYTKGDDYEMDYEEGQIKVLSTGTMADATDYYIDYTYDNTGVAMGEDGPLGDAMEFDGVDDYVETNNSYNPSSVSVSVWGNSDAWVSNDSEWNAMFAQQETSSPFKNFWLRNSGDPNEKMEWGVNVGGVSHKVYSADYGIDRPSLNTWFYLSGTYDGELLSFYLNNSEVGTNSGPSGALDASSQTAKIGSNPDFSNPREFDGLIDEVRISSVARSSEWISTEYANQNSPSTFYTLNTEETTNPDWYSTDWNFRKEITIDNTKVDDDLVSFPILINQDADSQLATEAQSDADDILFTDTNGYKLSHQIENYDSSDGSLRAWVKIPELSQSADTTIRMYYGNRTVANQENITDVWSNNYAGVWLMNEGEGTTVNDYSGNNNNGTMENMDPATDWVERDNGYALDFDGYNEYVQIPHTISLTNDFTIKGSFLKRSDGSDPAYGPIILPNPGAQPFAHLQNSACKVRMGGESWNTLPENLIGSWLHRAFVLNYNLDSVYTYGEGDLKGTKTGIVPNDTSSKPSWRIGAYNRNPTNDYHHDGYIFRSSVSSTARSAEWISTEYNNQNSPSTFYSLSSASSWDTTAPTNPTATNGWETSGKTTSITTGDWNNDSSPHFEWSGAADAGGSGMDGYYLYYGTNSSADPETTSGIIEDDSSAHLQSSASYTLDKSMTTDNTYYLRAKTIDQANNVSSATTLFTYKYDNQDPNPPEYVESDPAGCSTVNEFDMSWPAATDIGNSGIDYYQYKLSASGSVSTTSQLTKTVEPYQESDNVLYVRSVDNAGSQSDWRTGVFCVIGYMNITSGPQVDGNPASLTVSWQTDRKTSSYVRIYQNGEVITEQGNPEYVYNHQVEVVGLKPDANYRYRLIYADENGNQDSSGYFEAATTSPPQVQDMSVETLSPTSANISFKTTRSTTTQLLYGIKSYNKSKQLNTSPATRYSHNLTNLKPDTTYYLTAKATTNDGFSFHSDKHILTTPAYPKISNLRFQPVEDAPTSTLKVSWKTNVKTSSALTITPENQKKATKTASQAKLSQEHELTISNLSDKSKYVLTASGRDRYGNQATSDTQTFTTSKDSRPPKITDIKLETSLTGRSQEARAQLVINWQTDEPATSQVKYGIGTGGDSYQATTAKNTDLQKNHTVIISELEPQRTYHLRAISSDESGNLTRSIDNVVITSKAPENVLDIIINKLKETFGFLANIRETLGF